MFGGKKLGQVMRDRGGERKRKATEKDLKTTQKRDLPRKTTG